MNLSIFSILFFVLLLFSYKPSLKFNSEYIGLDNCVNLRGIMSIGIIFCHVILEIPSNEYGLFKVFLHVGYLFVSVFFMLSGYGLITNFKKRGEDYLQGFSKKILYFLSLYVLTNLLFVVVRLLRGDIVSAYDFFIHQPYLGTTWYLIMLIVMYLVFWVGVKLKLQNYKLVGFIFLIILGGSFALKVLGFHVMWYYSNLAFPVGVAIGYYKEIIDKILKKWWYLAFFACFIAFAFFSLSHVLLAKINYKIDLIEAKHYSRMLSTVAFSLIVVTSLVHLKQFSKIWYFLGIYSLEIYLLHAPIYFLMRSNVLYIQNSALFIIASVLLTVLCSIPAKHFNTFIKSKLKL